MKTSENPALVSDPPDDVHIPVHLDEECLTDEELGMVQKTLQKWKKVFAFTKTELGCAKGVQHRIVLTDDVPFKERS